jgi:hypothetical protein
LTRRLWSAAVHLPYCTDPQREALPRRERSSLDLDLHGQILPQAQRAVTNQACRVPLYRQYEILALSKPLNYRAAGDEMIRAFEHLAGVSMDHRSTVRGGAFRRQESEVRRCFRIRQGILCLYCRWKPFQDIPTQFEERLSPPRIGPQGDAGEVIV